MALTQQAVALLCIEANIVYCMLQDGAQGIVWNATVFGMQRLPLQA